MSSLTSSLELEKANDDVWNVYAITSHTAPGTFRRKNFAQFTKDVDGDWLVFFTGSGGFQRHTIADLAALFAQFVPNTYPGV